MRLHACAVAMVERHGGAVPDDLEQLLALPGIGTYTARAVATFAYGQRHPVVDTNVRRGIARVVEGAPDAGPAPPPPAWPRWPGCCPRSRPAPPGPASRSWSWARSSAPPVRPDARFVRSAR